MAKSRAQRKAEQRRREASPVVVPEPPAAPEPEMAPVPEPVTPAPRPAPKPKAVAKPKPKAAPVEERRRGAVLSFLASSWAELKRVQWPDRPTLVQASAVTLVFVAVAAAYLGALDAIFNWLVQRIL